METAKNFLEYSAPEALKRYEKMFPVSGDLGALSRHDLDELAAAMQDIEDISSQIYENFDILNSRFSVLEKHSQKRAEAA